MLLLEFGDATALLATWAGLLIRLAEPESAEDRSRHEYGHRSLRSLLCFIGSRARKFSFIGFARARAYSTRILVEKWSKWPKMVRKCIFDPIFGFYARKSTKFLYGKNNRT